MSGEVIIPPTLSILAVSTDIPADYNVAFWEALEAAFTVPAVSGTADIAVTSSSQYPLNGYIWVYGAGYFEVTSRPSTTSIRVTNNGTPGNAAPASVIAASTPFMPAPKPEKERWFEASDTWDPGSIADGDEEAKEITVTGAALGDFAIASFSLDVADLALSAAVTALDTVTVVLSNNTGGAIDLASGTVRVRVMPQS